MSDSKEKAVLQGLHLFQYIAGERTYAGHATLFTANRILKLLVHCGFIRDTRINHDIHALLDDLRQQQTDGERLVVKVPVRDEWHYTFWAQPNIQSGIAQSPMIAAVDRIVVLYRTGKVQEKSLRAVMEDLELAGLCSSPDREAVLDAARVLSIPIVSKGGAFYLIFAKATAGTPTGSPKNLTSSDQKKKKVLRVV